MGLILRTWNIETDSAIMLRNIINQTCIPAYLHSYKVKYMHILGPGLQTDFKF
jgi:hypothetical protein